MKWSPLKIYTLKLTLFSIVLAYLAVDLWWWHGPIWQAMHAEQPSASELSGETVLAEVLGEQITANQLARYEKEQNYLADRKTTDALRRTSMLMDLVRAATLRIRARYNDKNLPSDRQEAENEVQRLSTRAHSPEQFETWIKAQGYRNRSEFIDKVEARLRSTRLLERAIAPHCQVSDEDVKKHYELLKEQLMLPAHRTAKHIFFATHGKDEQQVRDQAAQIMDKLRQGENFDDLARQYSEDAHTAPQGGELGVLWDDARRPLPELPLFGAAAIPAHEPYLCKSKWGWHIISAGDINPARLQTLAECRDSIRSALMSAQREIAIDTYFTTGVREAVRRQSVKIHVSK